MVGKAETGRQARKLQPAVVVMDIAMPLLNGLEATRQIRKDCPATKVLILSAHSDDDYRNEATTFGAAGFLLKQTSSYVLATAIRKVQKGRIFLSPVISKNVQDRSHKSRVRLGLSKKSANRLSAREAEVLQLIAEDSANKQIAIELGVSFKTIDKHRQHLMAKLNIHDTTGLTRYAISVRIASGIQLTTI